MYSATETKDLGYGLTEVVHRPTNLRGQGDTRESAMEDLVHKMYQIFDVAGMRAKEVCNLAVKVPGGGA